MKTIYIMLSACFLTTLYNGFPVSGTGTTFGCISWNVDVFTNSLRLCIGI